MSRFPYDERYEPPMPVVGALIGAPGSPPQVAVPALLDSGADRTVVPAELARVLDLPVVGTIRVETVAGGRMARLHALSVLIEGLVVDVQAVAAADELLVGRDLLRRFVVTLDGPAGELTIGV